MLDFPKLETPKDVTNALRYGGIAGLLTAVLAFIGLLVLMFADRLAALGVDTPNESSAYLLGVGLQSVVSLLLTWRFWAHRGYVSGISLLAIWVVEAVWKLSSGAIGTIGLFIYVVVAIAIVNGVRACFAHQRIANEASPAGVA